MYILGGPFEWMYRLDLKTYNLVFEMQCNPVGSCVSS